MHRSSLLRSTRVPVAVALVLLGLAACGSDDDDDSGGGDSGTTTTAAPADDAADDAGATGTIVAEDFKLSDLTVGPGEELVLENQDDAPHTATADDDSFDSGEVAGGETSEPFTAPEEPGEYAFHCDIHTNMKATLTVEG